MAIAQELPPFRLDIKLYHLHQQNLTKFKKKKKILLNYNLNEGLASKY